MDGSTDRDLEERLLRERPRPDAMWQLELREQLFEPRRRTASLPFLRGRVIAAGAGLVAVAFGVAGVLGGGPLASLSNQPSVAKDECRFVTVQRERRVPRVVQTSTGPEIRYDVKTVPTRVKRCD